MSTDLAAICGAVLLNSFSQDLVFGCLGSSSFSSFLPLGFVVCYPARSHLLSGIAVILAGLFTFLLVTRLKKKTQSPLDIQNEIG